MANSNQSPGNTKLQSAQLLVAVALVMMGLYLAAFGNAWAPIVLKRLPDSGIGAWLELIVPFLPMVHWARCDPPGIGSPGPQSIGNTCSKRIATRSVRSGTVYQSC